MREQAFFHAYHEDHTPLASLGTVDCGEKHTIMIVGAFRCALVKLELGQPGSQVLVRALSEGAENTEVREASGAIRLLAYPGAISTAIQR
jgi:hypothetical protein